MFSLSPERLRSLSIGKLLLLAAIALVVLYVLYWAAQSLTNQMTGVQSGVTHSDVYVAQNGPGYAKGGRGSAGMAYDMAEEVAPMPPSVRNVLPPYDDGYVPGADAELFETRAYTAYIRTTNLARVCDTIEDWKPQTYVVFEEQTRSDESCHYRFKVERNKSDEVLAAVKALNPDELVADTETIKEQVVDYTSRLEILQSKEQVIENTLDQAVSAYEELVDLAKEAEDVSTLGKALDAKLQQVERLTMERINVASQIEQVAREKAKALDRLAYAHFSVSVSKYDVFDWDSIVNSWEHKLERFVYDVNTFIQAITLGLLMNLLRLALFLVYLFILLVLARTLWHYGRDFLKGRQESSGDQV
jgi:hypothetical protein